MNRYIGEITLDTIWINGFIPSILTYLSVLFSHESRWTVRRAVVSGALDTYVSYPTAVKDDRILRLLKMIVLSLSWVSRFSVNRSQGSSLVTPTTNYTTQIFWTERWWFFFPSSFFLLLFWWFYYRRTKKGESQGENVTIELWYTVADNAFKMNTHHVPSEVDHQCSGKTTFLYGSFDMTPRHHNTQYNTIPDVNDLVSTFGIYSSMCLVFPTTLI